MLLFWPRTPSAGDGPPVIWTLILQAPSPRGLCAVGALPAGEASWLKRTQHLAGVALATVQENHAPVSREAAAEKRCRKPAGASTGLLKPLRPVSVSPLSVLPGPVVHGYLAELK